MASGFIVLHDLFDLCPLYSFIDLFPLFLSPSSNSLSPTGLGLYDADLPAQMSVSDWPELRQTFTRVFASKTQEQWSRVFDGTDACVTPVLSLDEVLSHPHNQARGSFFKDSQGEISPRPAPVLSRSPAEPCHSRDPFIGEHTRSVLKEYGFKQAQIEQLLSAGIAECNEAKARL